MLDDRASPGGGRRDRSRRDRSRGDARLAAIVLFAVASSGPLITLIGLVGAGDWGSDWRWLADGLDRLGRGLPLNHPEYVAGPFSQFPDGPAFSWSLHPPWNATLVAPALLLPADLRQGAWTLLMAAGLFLAAWLVWPRGLSWPTNLLLAAAALGPPFVGQSVGLVDQLHYANPNALVLVGLALVWHGSRSSGAGPNQLSGAVPNQLSGAGPDRWRNGESVPAVALMTVGLVLAAVKITPAIALGAWLLAGRERRLVAMAAIVAATVVLLALTLPIVLLDPHVVGDTLAVAMHLIPWDGPANLAPGVRLAPLLGPELATWLARLVAAALLGLVVGRRLAGGGGLLLATIAALLLTPQLWAHWLLIPIAAALLAARDLEPLRRLDSWLRPGSVSEWTGVPARR